MSRRLFARPTPTAADLADLPAEVRDRFPVDTLGRPIGVNTAREMANAQRHLSDPAWVEECAICAWGWLTRAQYARAERIAQRRGGAA